MYDSDFELEFINNHLFKLPKIFKVRFLELLSFFKLLELWAEMFGNLCFSSSGDATTICASALSSFSNTHLMFCLTRAFQFDTHIITIKQSTLTLGPTNFLLLLILGQTVVAITRQFKSHF